MKNNLNFIYQIVDCDLTITTQKGNGVKININSSKKAPPQRSAAVKKINQMLGTTRKGVNNKTENTVTSLDK